MNDRPLTFKVRENDQAPVVYGDQFLHVQFNGFTLEIVVGAARAIPEKTGGGATQKPTAVVTGRLVLTPNAADGLMKALQQMAAVLSAPPNVRPN